MIRKITSLALVAGLLAGAGAAFAGNGCVEIIRGGQPAPEAQVRVWRVDAHRPGEAYLVERPVVDPALTVGRALAQQPIWPWLVEVHLGTTVVYLDPDQAYEYEHPYGGTASLDENNLLVRALALWRNVNGNRAQIIYGAPPRPHGSTAELPRPRFILEKPTLQEQPGPADQIPNLPQSPADMPRQVAQGPTGPAMN